MNNATGSNNLPLIVTGLSGAGISSVLKHLEDLGHEVFDNFPLSLVQQLVNDPAASGRPTAIGIDTRSRGFSPEALLESVRNQKARLLFLTADENVLQQSVYRNAAAASLGTGSSGRRGHSPRNRMAAPFKNTADRVIDTSELSIHELRRLLEKAFGQTKAARLTVTLLSFAFRHGLPREADMVLDVRFLRNPHWDPVLKPLTGLDEQVRAYVASDDAFEPFLHHFRDLLSLLLPRYAQEGKSYLTVAIGCTGGRHRSVTAVEILKSWLEEQDFAMNIHHRDIDRA